MILKTKLYGITFGVRADWENAACPVEDLGEDGWISTQYQVADFRHNAHSALCTIIVDMLSFGGAIDMSEVEKAVNNAKEIDEN